jgi:hypothetical protein
VETLDQFSDLLDRFGAPLRHESRAFDTELLRELAVAGVQDSYQMARASRGHDGRAVRLPRRGNLLFTAAEKGNRRAGCL